MTSRLEALEKKLAARAGIPGYEKNCEDIRAEIARITACQEQAATSPVASETNKD
jgi:hypothetical protein